MKRTILFFVIGCLFSLCVAGQYNPGLIAGSAGNDTTKQQSSIMFKSLTFPVKKGLNFTTGMNYNYWQPGDKKQNQFGYTFCQDYYRFKNFEIGVTYQNNMTNTLKTNYITSDLMRGWKLVRTTPFNFR